MKNSKFTTSAAVTAAVIIGIAGTGIATNTYAATSQEHIQPRGELISAIATRFNLKESEVQEVFARHHKQMTTEREQKLKEKLAQAVRNGALTQAQADALIAKHAEMKAKNGGFRMGQGHRFNRMQ